MVNFRPQGGRIAVHAAVGSFPKEEIPVADQAAGHIVRSGLHRPDHLRHAAGVGCLPGFQALHAGICAGLFFNLFDRLPAARPLGGGFPEGIDGGQQTSRQQPRKQDRNPSFHLIHILLG